MKKLEGLSGIQELTKEESTKIFGGKTVAVIKMVVKEGGKIALVVDKREVPD